MPKKIHPQEKRDIARLHKNHNERYNTPAHYGGGSIGGLMSLGNFISKPFIDEHKRMNPWKYKKNPYDKKK